MSNSALISKGSFKCVEDANGKYIQCPAGSSVLALPSSFAYGTWEWDAYLPIGDNAFVSFDMTSDRATGANLRVGVGYSLVIDTRYQAVSNIALRRNSVGAMVDLAQSVSGSIPLNQWVKIKVTRNAVGGFYVYINGVLPILTSGTFPKTDTTLTTSDYFIFHPYDVANAAMKNLKHFQGVEV